MKNLKVVNEIPGDPDEDYRAYLKTEPRFEVGSWRLVGKPNSYDVLAKKLGILYGRMTKYFAVSIPSGYKVRTVTRIMKQWNPKKQYAGTEICSWLSYGDYSHDPRFEPCWEIEYDDEPMFYELADFLQEMLS